MTQKALLQSAGDGTAVPSGYVGEIKSAERTTNIGGLTAGSSLGISVTVSAGTWIYVFKSDVIASTDMSVRCKEGSTILGYNRHQSTTLVQSDVYITTSSFSGADRTLVMEVDSGAGAATGGASGTTFIKAIRIA